MKRSVVPSKEVLAKLMAKESLVVVYNNKSKTASFDPKSRLLSLPVMTGKEEYVYDWFIAHEVSHALYTPSNSSFYANIQDNTLMRYFNVTEDARIEKLIKLKYPGTKKDCRRFYEHFADPEVDFFKIKDKDIKSLALIDRINLHFKIGHIHDIPFSDDEMEYVDMVDYAMTPEAALEAARKILEKSKRDKQQQQQQQHSNKYYSKSSSSQSNDSGDSGDSEEGSSESSESSESRDSGDSEEGSSESSDSGDSGDSEEGSSESSDSNDSGDSGDSEGESSESNDSSEPDLPITQDGFDKAMEEMFDKNPSNVEYSTVDSNAKSISTILSEMERNTNVYENNFSNISRFDKYTKLMASAKPLVGMMVSYFNMRKKASEYQKTLQSKTGHLDTSRLANYMCSSDVFLRKDVVKDSQNHGLFFLLDWSGSMQTNIIDTFKQTLILIEFCRLSKIPYELYAFTSGGNRIVPDNLSAHGIMYSTEGTSFIRLLHNNMSYQQHKKASEHILMGNHVLNMNCTPLCGAITVCENLIRNFQKINKCEKTIFCILTDGSSTDYVGSIGGQRHPDFIIDRKFNKYSVKSKDNCWQALTEYMKNSCNIYSTIGFYLCERTVYNFAGTFIPSNSPNASRYSNELKQKGIFETNEVQGYDRYFFLTTKLLSSYLNDINTNDLSSLSTTANSHDIDNAFKTGIAKHSLKSMQFLKVFIEQIS